jgi:hypothetical protein
VEAEVIFINEILKNSEMIFSQVTHLMQALLASAPINNVMIKFVDPEVIFVDKIWNDPNNIHASSVPAAAGLGLHQ